MVKPTISSFVLMGELIIQKYERYLPTAFDESMTLLEKVNKVIEYLNQTGLLVNDVVTQWNTVMEWVMGDGLTEDVSNKLDSMVEDGTLESLINMGIIGNLSELKTTNKNDLVSAINEISDVIHEPFHLHIGQNQKYKTITSAFNEWKNPSTINEQPTVFHIYKGVYEESIAFYGKNPNVSFIGESAKDVIWKTTQGYYQYHPLTISGDVYIEGIHFIADYSKNPLYNFTTYTGGNTGGAYGLHIDVEGATGKTTVKDCIIESFQNAGIGSGTRSNQEIELINTEVYSYAKTEWAEAVNNGAWLYHNSINTGAINERLKARNCKFHSANAHAIELQSYNTDTTYIISEFINNTFSSGKIVNPKDMIRLTLRNNAPYNKVFVSTNSHGNNIQFLNNIHQYVDHNGFAPSLTDLNNAITGQHQCNTGALNAPETNSAFYITTILANSQYGLQTARKMGSITTKYKREKVAGTWQAWSLD